MTCHNYAIATKSWVNSRLFWACIGLCASLVWCWEINLPSKQESSMDLKARTSSSPPSRKWRKQAFSSSLVRKRNKEVSPTIGSNFSPPTKRECAEKVVLPCPTPPAAPLTRLCEAWWNINRKSNVHRYQCWIASLIRWKTKSPRPLNTKEQRSCTTEGRTSKLGLLLAKTCLTPQPQSSAVCSKTSACGVGDIGALFSCKMYFCQLCPQQPFGGQLEKTEKTQANQFTIKNKTHWFGSHPLIRSLFWRLKDPWALELPSVPPRTSDPSPSPVRRRASTWDESYRVNIRVNDIVKKCF